MGWAEPPRLHAIRSGGSGLLPKSESARESTIEFAASFYKIPALMTYRVRCGKANCRCARGAGHGPYAFLHWRDRTGKQCRRYVRASDVAAVQHIIEKRRAHRNAERLAKRVAVLERRMILRELREWFR
jgi:hypothetical protein